MSAETLKRKRTDAEMAYKMLGLLGTGTFGTVFGLVETKSQSKLALKLLKRTKDHFDSYETQDMIREIFGSMTFGPSFAFVQGAEQRTMTLGPWLGPDLQTMDVLDQDLEILLLHLKPIVDHLQLSKFMHRDIKPANIVMPTDGSIGASLIDFSLSTSKQVSSDFSVITCWYRAPEVFMKVPYDQKVDVWSMGLVILYCITGTVLSRASIDDTEESNQLLLEDLFDHLGWPDTWAHAVDFCRANKMKMKRFAGFLDLEATIRKCRPDLTFDIVRPLGNLLHHMLQINPVHRYTWSQVQEHPLWTMLKYPENIQRHGHALAKCATNGQVDSLIASLNENPIIYKRYSETSWNNATVTLHDLHAMRVLVEKSRTLKFSDTTAHYAYLIMKRIKIVEPEFSKDYLLCISLFLAASFHEDIRSQTLTWARWCSLFHIPWNQCEHYVFEGLSLLQGQWPHFNWNCYFKSVEDAIKIHKMDHLHEYRHLWPVMTLVWATQDHKELLEFFNSILYFV